MTMDSTRPTPGLRRMLGYDADLGPISRVDSAADAPRPKRARGGVRPIPPEGSDEWDDMPNDSVKGPVTRKRG
jgi:hypothetical protein